MNINYPYITEYIKNTIAPNSKFLQEIENYAEENNIPIVQKETAKLIEVLCMIKKPAAILEIGTAIGYSAILMAESVNRKCKIVTIEKSSKMFKTAKKNIKLAGLEDQINIIYGDAIDVLDNINQTFDLIFVDASKSHYMEFLNKCINKLNINGIIISDNVLFKGMVANDELVDRRNKTIKSRMRKYLDYICSMDEFETSIIPIGDGVAVSAKKDS